MLSAGAGLLGSAWFGNGAAGTAACWGAIQRVSGRLLQLQQSPT